jgi:arylsulfatase A-like enzyme
MGEKNMDRRAFMRMAAAGTAALMAPACKRPSFEKQPNILIVFDDQLRADVCGVYGGNNIATPHIDRLAAQGATFANSISSCPLCTPYRGMLQTGRYPTHSGIIMNFVEASQVQNPHCLANVFGEAGYDTGFIGKWHLSSGWRREEGLYKPDQAAVKRYREKNPETEYVAPGSGRLGYRHWQAFNFHTAFNDYYYYENTPKRIFSGRYETDTQIDQAIAFIERHNNSGNPFLLCVAPHPPHPPFAPEYLPEGYLSKVPEDIHWSPNVPADNPRKLEEMRYYLAMSKNVDDNLGRLTEYLELSGQAENTILVFTADHGEMHGSHGRLNKMVPYAEAMNVPLIVRWPKRIRPGTRIDALHTPMDHFPTLCGLAGIRIPREVDGRDLSGSVLGKEKDGREEVLIGSYTSHWDFFQSGTLWPEWRGVRSKQHTYCRWLSGEEELYDNMNDPYQMTNLAAGLTELPTLKSMRGRLKDFLAAAHDDFRPGSAYGEWYDERRNLIRTGLGPVEI